MPAHLPIPGSPLFGHIIAELVFTLIAVVLCWAIYFRTRESYELSKHKGIGYFRDAFLFFGLAYLIRFLIGLMFISSEAFGFSGRHNPLFFLLILLVGYCSTMSIFYLLFSSLWKKVNTKRILVAGHVLAILLSITAFALRSQEVLLIVQSVLLAIVIIVGWLARTKKISRTRILYFLVSGLWLINLWIVQNPSRLPLSVKLVALLFSIGVFVYIYYKVSKWVA